MQSETGKCACMHFAGKVTATPLNMTSKTTATRLPVVCQAAKDIGFALHIVSPSSDILWKAPGFVAARTSRVPLALSRLYKL